VKKIREVRLLSAAFVVLVLLLSCQDSTSRIHLRLQLVENESYTLRLISEQMITQTPYGRHEQTSKMMGIGFVFDVEEVNAEGDAHVQIAIQSAQFKHEDKGGVIEYDSAHDVSSNLPPEARGIAAFIGEHFNATITPQGNVKSLEGIEQMMTRILEKLALPEGQEKEAAREQFQAEFGGTALQEMIENVLAVYPSESVTVGESWNRASRVSEGLPLILNNTWTLKSLENGRAVLSVVSDAEPYLDSSAATGVDVFHDFQGIKEGTFVLDATSGWILEGMVSQRIWGRVVLEGGQQLGQSVSWPIEIEGTTTLGPLG
jgi:hypothetical protein